MRSLSLPLSVPDDVALKIASLLQVPDLSALASCSLFWREICGSDCIWEPLVRDRWPPLEFSYGSSSSTAIKKNHVHGVAALLHRGAP
ncbi:hypothetical protein Pyn_14914 [Prunus yedoensis var. nudiflora]|uniref:F-box domain-containing protein n=1 Tax=Prunus yedoensis var. nudiflora TaxID=2094558 RepID=A0A314ZTM1_PRUYE|nr:hypothetical protein Pyn_14914 [Prunus yedoensis var. nudiflora]